MCLRLFTFSLPSGLVKRSAGMSSVLRCLTLMDPSSTMSLSVMQALGMTQVSAVEIVERAEGEVILGRTYDQAYASTQEMVTVSRFPK